MTTPLGTVLQVSTTDGTGGAARAARRLHDGLEAAGWESWMVAGLAHVGGDHTTTLLAEVQPTLAPVEALAPYVRSRFGELRMPLPASAGFSTTELFRRASIINLHNLHGGYFDYATLPRWAVSKPIVWTLHDMWSFTGHCAYSFGCDRWATGCHRCPMWHEFKALDEIPRTPWDNSRGEWRRKRDVYARTPIIAVAPTRWLGDLAQRSILAPEAVHVVPYGLDTDAYAPMDCARARELVGLPIEAPVVAFGPAALAQERKGATRLIEALARVRKAVPQVQLLAMGATIGLPPELADARTVGDISDERMQRVIYACADLLALPSLADNQPLSMLESMACGIPVVAFEVGGIPETIRDGETGLLARADDPAMLADRIVTLLRDRELRERIGRASRQHIEREHALARQAGRYATIYARALSGRAEAVRPSGRYG